jgi:hypothetical protein
MAPIDIVLLHRSTAENLKEGFADLTGYNADALPLLACGVRRNKG